MRLQKTLNASEVEKWGTPASWAWTRRYEDCESTENSASDGGELAEFPVQLLFIPVNLRDSRELHFIQTSSGSVKD